MSKFTCVLFFLIYSGGAQTEAILKVMYCTYSIKCYVKLKDSRRDLFSSPCSQLWVTGKDILTENI